MFKIDIEQLHSIANRINQNWDELQNTRKQFVNERDFYDFIISATMLALASE